MKSESRNPRPLPAIVSPSNEASRFFGSVTCSMRLIACAMVAVLLSVFASPVKAGTETLPAGTYIIPMDNALQSLPGKFNIKSYGLAIRLLHAGVPIKWIISPTKGKDGVDFTANASRIKPTALGSATRSFRAGPFAIHPGFEAQALAVINSFGNNVAVYQLTAPATVFVDATLLHKPKVAVFNEGGNAAIHTAILANAGLTSGTHYQVLNGPLDIDENSCFTCATEPHSDVTTAAGAAALSSFLRSGGNFLGQCHAVESYLNRGLISGFLSKADFSGTGLYANFSNPMAQFDGVLDVAEGGSVHSFKMTSNPGFRIVYSSTDGARYKAYAARITGVTTVNGGWVDYLAGHNYDGGSIGQVNGQRILLNTVMRAADRPANCGLSIASDLGVTKVVNNSTPNIGSNVTFTIVATNYGPVNNTGVVVNDLLPAGLTYVSHTTTGGTYTPGSGVWAIGALNSGASRTLTITATATAAAIPSKTNTATVSGDLADSNLTNNTASATVTPIYADLRVLKTVNNSVQTVGQQVTFTVSATNLGPNNATGATVNDLLPAGLIYVSHSASAGIYNSGTGVWSIGSLANGATQTLTITATVTLAAMPSVINTATVTANEYDPNLGNNTATSTVTPAVSDLAVVKTVNNGGQNVGGNVIFTILATNNGPATNTGVTVNDLLPNGLVYVSHSASIGTYNPGSGAWFIGNMISGASQTLTITATVTVAAVPTVTNTATIGGNVYDPNPNNNTSSAVVSPNVTADLAVVKTVSNATPLLGSNVTFTIQATNNGPVAGTGVVVSDPLPAGFTYVSSVPSVGTYNPATGAWAIGNLAVGQTQTLTITVTVTAAAIPSRTNVATISGLESDPIQSNNTSSVVVTPNVAADLSVVKTVSDANPTVGDNVTFNIVATNNGPSAATGTSVSDLLPSGLDYVSHTLTSGTYIPASGAWSIGNLAVGQSQTLTIVAKTTIAGAPSVVNTATVTANEPDPNLTNNTSSVSVNILTGADVAIVKTVDDSTPFIGQIVTFTVTTSNAGPEDATNVLISDTFPAGFANATNISGGGVLSGNTITWPPQNILSGGSVAFTFQVTVVTP